jgi:hypothetical protein
MKATVKKKATLKSVIVWKGPSEFDGSPIALVIKYPTKGKGNSKTGNICQTYILPAGEHVVDALHAGRDVSVCWHCPHRGDGTGKGRTCYVSLATGLNVVSRNLMAEKYLRATPEGAARGILGKQLRMGTYGDPAAVPESVWAVLAASATRVLGYTHQWRRPQFAYLSRWCMASADTESDVATANAAGWRTFRVAQVGSPTLSGEVVCPASKEAGEKVQCDRCGLCQGSKIRAKNIVIVRHDRTANAQKRRLKVLK